MPNKLSIPLEYCFIVGLLLFSILSFLFDPDIGLVWLGFVWFGWVGFGLVWLNFISYQPL